MSITSKSENTLVFNLSSSAGVAARWLGAKLIRTSTPQTLSGVFNYTWIDGSIYTTMASEFAGCIVGQTCLFKKNEPSDSSGIEDCLVMGGTKNVLSPAGWNDVSCAQRNHYVCERSISVTG